MRILQICAAYKPAYIYGGPTMSVSMLSEQLVEAGITVEVYATTANGKRELPVTAGKPVMVSNVKVTYFKRLTKDHSHFSPALLKKVWQQSKNFDIVHIHAWWNLVSLLNCLIALMRNVKVVVSPRGTLSSYSFQNKNIGPKWLIHHLLGKYLLQRCAIHATSHQEKNAVEKLIDNKSITVLPNFVKLPPQSPAFENRFHQPIKLLFFSRIEEKKGLELLINALPGIKMPYHLTVAGTGEPAYIENLKVLASNCRVADKITWAGYQNEQKFNLLRQHDLFILPSYDENFGNVVIESLSVGTPVLISEQVGLAGYVLKNSLGWVCKTDSSSISDAVNKIGADGAWQLKQIAETAPGIIYRDFNTASLIKQYISWYKQLILQ